MSDLIFIQIASYRDSEINKTIADCIEKADAPENLRFGIMEQVSSGDMRVEVRRNMLIRTIHNTASKGACWARAMVGELYQGEKYTLQIDSHSRFMQGWDRTLIDYMEQAPSNSPIISTYPHCYWLDDYGFDQFGQTEPSVSIGMPFFNDYSIVELRSMPLKFDKPLWRARTLSAGFFFTYGSFIKSVPYDSSLYFWGEEISMSVRAWCDGWDIFSPEKCPIFHHYVREKGPRHWQDHNADALNDASLAKVRGMLEEKAGFHSLLWQSRTLAEYQEFAGVNFKERTLTEAAKLGLEPE